tara:strand:+ start:242 stop:601 length:360 start_codon:yes stop_codon:yes gene_type:complete
MYHVSDNPELASIVWRCLAGARVPAHQWARYSHYLTTTVVTIELGFRKIWANEVDVVTTKTWVEGADFWFKYPGMRTWWKAGQIGYSDRFRAYIDQRLDFVEVDGRDAEAIVALLHNNG